MSAEFNEQRFPPGGVLSSTEIKRLVDCSPPEQTLIEDWDPTLLKAARYDVRVELDTPPVVNGVDVPLESELVAQYRNSLILHPGGSAWFSTTERFCLPRDVAGAVTLRSEFAARGLFLLSGTLIDPCYGAESEQGGRPLHFFLANLGCEPIVLQPEKDAIASVQFLIVSGEVEETRARDPGDSRAPAEATLGFIENLQRLQRSHMELRDDVERTRGLTNGLIVVGYFVLGTAVISASLATILSITSDSNLVNDIHSAVPKHDAGKWLLATMAASLAIVIYAAAVVLGPGRRRSSSEELTQIQEVQNAVLRELRSKAKTRVLSVLVFAMAVALALGRLIAALDSDLAYWAIWLILYAGLAIATIVAVQRLRGSFTTQEIKQRMSELASRAREREVRRR